MKLKQIVIISAAFLLTAGVTRAQTAHVWSDPSGWWDAHFAYDINAPRYTAQELSLDLFGSYINPEGKFTDLFDTNIRHGFWGGGAGLNYFITRELGLGVDFNMSDKPEGRLVDDVVGNVFVRLPLGNSGVAPYFFGSGGRGISPIYQWVYGGGVGLEYRWNPATGIFTDARFLWGDKGTVYNKLLIRAGLRIVF
jgi:hypothetical protein